MSGTADTVTAQKVNQGDYNMNRTANPIHDAAMYDIELRREAEDYDPEDYPTCDICGDHILPDEEFFSYEDLYFHRECIPFDTMRWKR